MKFHLKDEPGQWRKSALLTIFGLAILTSALHWRHILANRAWFIFLSLLVLMAVAAVLQPRWFRGYHIFSMRLGFRFSQILGWTFLVLFFFLVLVPMSWVLRLAGKDILQLKRPPDADTYWQKTKDFSSGPAILRG